MQARLTAANGGLVAVVEIPPFQKLPEALVWGSRFFILASQNASDGIPVYAEGLAFYVPDELVKPEASAKCGVCGKPAHDNTADYPEFSCSPAQPIAADLESVPTPFGAKVSTSGRITDLHGPSPDPETNATGQHKGYWVLSDEERAKGFVRPVRHSYLHVGNGGPKHPTRDLAAEEQERYASERYVKFEVYPESESPVNGRFWTQDGLNKAHGCGTVTTMGQAIAETYAREPGFYGSTFCCGCGTHLPVGEHGEFVWCDERRRPTAEKVGT